MPAAIFQQITRLTCRSFCVRKEVATVEGTVRRMGTMVLAVRKYLSYLKIVLFLSMGHHAAIAQKPFAVASGSQVEFSTSTGCCTTEPLRRSQWIPSSTLDSALSSGPKLNSASIGYCKWFCG